MAQTIKIKRSTSTAAPTTLANAELAYSSNSDKLYIGRPGGSTSDVDCIGGKVFTDKLDLIEASADVTDTANVTAAGALMDSEVTNLAEVKAFDSSDYATAAQGDTADAALPKAGGTMTGNLQLGDDDKLQIGSKTDGDLQIYHDGSHSYIDEVGEGLLYIQTDGLGIKMRSDWVGTMYDVIDILPVGVSMKYLGSVVWNTVSGGVKTTGDTETTTLTATSDVSVGGDLTLDDGGKVKLGTGGDLELFHDGSNSIIKDAGDGILRYTSANSTAQGVVLEVENTDSTNLSGSFIHFKDSLGITPAKIGALSNEMYLMRGSNDDRILVTNNSAVELYCSDVKVFETTSSGINVVGEVQGDSLDIDGNADISGTLIAGNFTFTGDEISSSGSTMTLDPHADGITGKVVVNGDLEVKGTTTTIDSTQVTINDAYLQLNSGLGASATPVSSMICGFEVNRGAGETGRTHDAGLYWYEAADEWRVSEGQTASHALVHANNFESVITSLDGGTF